MALTWNWEDKIGTVNIPKQRLGKYDTFHLYKCNGLIVALVEFEENKKPMYTMGWFFVDLKHCKSCFKNDIFSDAFEFRFYLKRDMMNSELYKMLFEFMKYKNTSVEWR